jgi:hypothetical protein
MVGQAFQFFGEFKHEALLQAGIESGGAFFRIGILVFRHQFAEAHAPFFFPQPILKAAAPPFGDIILRDGPAGKALGENVYFFRQCVQPRDEVFAERAIVEAAV